MEVEDDACSRICGRTEKEFSKNTLAAQDLSIGVHGEQGFSSLFEDQC